MYVVYIYTVFVGIIKRVHSEMAATIGFARANDMISKIGINIGKYVYSFCINKLYLLGDVKFVHVR